MATPNPTPTPTRSSTPAAASAPAPLLYDLNSFHSSFDSNSLSDIHNNLFPASVSAHNNQDSMFELLCCSNELCLPFADHNGQVCDQPSCLDNLNHNLPSLQNAPDTPSPACPCCLAGCPPSPRSLVPSRHSAFSRLSSSLSDSPRLDHSRPPSPPCCDGLSEDIVWINKELEELIKCCCCDLPTESNALPTHHADAHPSHHVNFNNLFSNNPPCSSLPFVVQPPPDGFRCQWRACTGLFPTRAALAQHVNQTHLAQDAAPTSNSDGHLPTSEAMKNQLEMLLVSCGLPPDPSPAPQSIPPLPSHAPDTPHNPTWLPRSFTAPQPAQSTDWTEPVHSVAGPCPSDKTQYPGPSGSAQKEEHLCRWEGCSGLWFPNTAALTAHISDVHVGSGRSHYSCLWEGCHAGSSNGAGGDRKRFNQRQKVMRHLQTHTGDRPFVCDVCGRRFGEMATLVQHGRTHTNEKPYQCDHPHCHKQFSLQSALTIHKRTHTGLRPFKCPYEGCLARFGESSNLSKHMKVHSGVKKFACEVCGRKFARSDQVGRHKRNGCGGGGATGATGGGGKGKGKGRGNGNGNGNVMGGNELQ